MLERITLDKESYQRISAQRYDTPVLRNRPVIIPGGQRVWILTMGSQKKIGGIIYWADVVPTRGKQEPPPSTKAKGAALLLAVLFAMSPVATSAYCSSLSSPWSSPSSSGASSPVSGGGSLGGSSPLPSAYSTSRFMLFPQSVKVDTRRCDGIQDAALEFESRAIEDKQINTRLVSFLRKQWATVYAECSPTTKMWFYQVLTRAFNQLGEFNKTDYYLYLSYPTMMNETEALHGFGAKIFDRWGRARMHLEDYAGADSLFALSDSLYWLRAEQPEYQHDTISQEHAMMLVNAAWGKRYLEDDQAARCLLERGVRPLQASCLAQCSGLVQRFINQADSLRGIVARHSNPVRCAERVPILLQQNDDGTAYWKALAGFIALVIVIGTMVALRSVQSRKTLEL